MTKRQERLTGPVSYLHQEINVWAIVGQVLLE